MKARTGRQPLGAPTSPGTWVGRLRNRRIKHSPAPIRQKSATPEIKGSNGKEGKQKPQSTSTTTSERQEIKRRQGPKTSKATTSLIRSRIRSNQTVQRRGGSIVKPLQLRREKAKDYLKVAKRRKNLEEDERCGEVQEHSVRCLLCTDKTLVELDKRGKFHTWNWDKHLIILHPDSYPSRSQNKDGSSFNREQRIRKTSKN